VSAAVDAFVRQKVLPEHRAVVALVRTLMRDCAPTAVETIYYGIPMWRGVNQPLAWMSPTKKDITFSFTHGVEFDDRYGLLRGAAKHARYVKLRTVQDANVTALRHYIRQAAKLDAKR
jgi:uncharacterized protein YdhG (YjbR/CyaY superfamily)